MYKFLVLSFKFIRESSQHAENCITHITEVVSILLGQDNSWEVHNTGELDSTWGLAIEPVIENCLGISSFNDIHRVLR